MELTLTQSLPDFEKIANTICRSKMIPTAYYNKPEEAIVCMMYGHSVGLTPLAALNGIAVINGKPSMYGDALLAVVYASGKLEDKEEYFEGEGENVTAICSIKRVKHANRHMVRFSVNDAKKAGLWARTSPSPWATAPKRMLQMRARGFALRDVFPDILQGIITREEAEDYNAATASAETNNVSLGATTRTVIEIKDIMPEQKSEQKLVPATISEETKEIFEEIKNKLTHVSSHEEFNDLMNIVKEERSKMTHDQVDQLREVAQFSKRNLNNDNLFVA